MKKNLGITKPRHSEQIVPVPWPIITSRFHCSLKCLFFAHTVQRGNNDESRDQQNMFAITRFLYIEIFFHTFYSGTLI